MKIRKVSIDVGLPGRGLSHLAPAILQGSCSLEHTVPSERLGTRRGTGGHKETTAHYRVRVDGAREHHEVHQRELHQQTGAGA